MRDKEREKERDESERTGGKGRERVIGEEDRESER